MSDKINESDARMEGNVNANSINMRPPSKHTYHTSKAATSSASAPTYDWFKGTWNVAYSTLPLWKDKQNVRISYTTLESSVDSDKMPDLDDHVQYQKIGSSKDNSIHGISRPVEVDQVPFGMAYHWRGKGWLKIASSSWEVLGWGTDTASSSDWAVICFSKTIFTPAGIDVFSRSKAGLSADALEKIKSTLEALADESWAELVKGLYEVPRT